MQAQTYGIASRWSGLKRNRVRQPERTDRKSTRLNSSHLGISYAVFCLKKKTEVNDRTAEKMCALVQPIICYIHTGQCADVRCGSTDKVQLLDNERTQLQSYFNERNGHH